LAKRIVHLVTVTALTIFPVKSMKGVSLRASAVDLIGLRHDRRWLVVDHDNKFQTIREDKELAQIEAVLHPDGLTLKHPTKGSFTIQIPDSTADSCSVRIWRSEVNALRANKDAGAFLSEILGKPLQLIYLANEAARQVNPKFSTPNDHVSFADGYPISIASESSWQDLQHRSGLDLSMRRFRINIIVTGADSWAEDQWTLIQIGAVKFRIARPIGRCVVTTLDPDTGDKNADNEPLATLSKFHRAADWAYFCRRRSQNPSNSKIEFTVISWLFSWFDEMAAEGRSWPQAEIQIDSRPVNQLS
jgi:uncharacterized protein